MSTNSKKAELNISGMSCSGCANAVKKALTQLDGVEHATANNEDNTAAVVYDADKVTPADFEQAVKSAGYTYEGIK